MTAFVQGAVEQDYNGSVGRATAVITNRQTMLALNRAYAAAGATIATTTTKIKTVNSVPYTIDGSFVTALAGTDNFWVLTGGVLAVSSFRVYLLCANASAAESVIASSDGATAAQCYFTVTPGAADPLDGVCIISTVLVATDATHAFTPGTTALSATGITATYGDGPGKYLLPKVGGTNATVGIMNALIGPNSYLG